MTTSPRSQIIAVSDIGWQELVLVGAYCILYVVQLTNIMLCLSKIAQHKTHVSDIFPGRGVLFLIGVTRVVVHLI